MKLQPVNTPADSPITHTNPVKQLAQILCSVPAPRRANAREKFGRLEETFLVSGEEQRPNKQRALTCRVSGGEQLPDKQRTPMRAIPRSK
jgi:hypothetical protein